jgi:small subunit ribosomal protein S6
MNYESTFIISPEVPAEKVEELSAKVVKIIEDSKGTFKTAQQLGKKRFAYPINKLREGSYVYTEFSGNGETINALKNFFKFNDLILRFLTVKVKKKKVDVKKIVKTEPRVVVPQEAKTTNDGGKIK